MFVCLFVGLLACCLFGLFVCLFDCLIACLFVCFFVSLFLCLFACLFVSLSVCLSVCLCCLFCFSFVCFFVSFVLCVCLFVCLIVWLELFDFAVIRVVSLCLVAGAPPASQSGPIQANLNGPVFVQDFLVWPLANGNQKESCHFGIPQLDIYTCVLLPLQKHAGTP